MSVNPLKFRKNSWEEQSCFQQMKIRATAWPRILSPREVFALVAPIGARIRTRQTPTTAFLMYSCYFPKRVAVGLHVQSAPTGFFSPKYADTKPTDIPGTHNTSWHWRRWPQWAVHVGVKDSVLHLKHIGIEHRNIHSQVPRDTLGFIVSSHALRRLSRQNMLCIQNLALGEGLKRKQKRIWSPKETWFYSR